MMVKVSVFGRASDQDVEIAEAQELFHDLAGEWPARLGFPDAGPALIGYALMRLRASLREGTTDEKSAREALAWARDRINHA